MDSMAGSKGMAASPLFERGGQTSRLSEEEEGEEFVPGHEVLEMTEYAKAAIDRLKKKGDV